MKRILLISLIALITCYAKAQVDPIYHSTILQFTASVKASDELTKEIYSLLNTPSVKQQLKATYDGYDPGMTMKILYCYDICTSVREMGGNVENLANLAGLPIMIQLFHDDNGKPNNIRLEHIQLSRTQNFLKSEQEWLGKAQAKLLRTNTNNRLYIIDLLSDAGREDLYSGYYNAMYKYCHFIANADKNITPKENAWLNKLKNMATGGNGSSTTTGNNGNSTTTAQNTTAQTTKTTATKTANDEDDPFMRLDNLIGLDEVKEKVRTLANTIKIQKMKESRGMKTQAMSYHCVFLGNPGTGKTTVARILADIYRQLGVVKKGHLVETDRSGLIASYIGQTAPKVNHMCDSAMNGILFIDEAYAITQGGQNDYGQEAIATLLKRMEDDRDKFVVILAGYSKEMGEFLETNSGIKSRINNYINFPDYTSSELFQIFVSNVKKNDCVLAKDAEQPVKDYISNAVAHKDAYFGNARFVRNFVEKVLEEQANRLAASSDALTDEMLRRLERKDVENAIRAMRNNQ